MSETKVCPICGSDAKFMKDSKTHCNCSNKDCLLSGDKYFHVDKWNKRTSARVPSEIEIMAAINKAGFDLGSVKGLEIARQIRALLTERK